jgi:hypothetical protein
MAAVSSHIRSVQQAPDPPADAERTLWSRIFDRYGAHIGFSAAGLLLVIGWLGRETRDLSAERGLGYFLGIAGLVCMLLLLVYPLRKRLRFLAFLGATKNWFRTHMILGTLGPLAALYHCDFEAGAVNSAVALVAALLVASSGFVGRFIYSKIHVGLYGRRATLKELLARIELAAPAAARAAKFIPELNKRLVAFDRSVLVPPKGWCDSMILPFRLAILTRLQYWKLARFAHRRLIVEATLSERLKQNRRRVEAITKQYIARHLREVRRVAEFTAYQRLFALWHVIHRPFFVILFVSVAIHVFAVHYY